MLVSGRDRPPTMLIGGHVSSAGGIHTAIDRVEAIGGEAVQLFTQSPRAWRPTAHDPANLERFRERRAEAGVGYVLCHALYLINLATPDRDLYEKSSAALMHTLDVAREIEGDVVFHIGSHLGAGLDGALARIAAALEQALERTTDSTWLLLENSAGAGGTIGRSLEELGAVVDTLDRPPRLGLCLDTCHLWVSGVDVTDPGACGRSARRGRRADRPRSPPRAARQRREHPARLEPGPTCKHRRRSDR